MIKRKERIDLPNALLMLVIHVLGFYGFYKAFTGAYQRETIILGVVMYCVSGLGVTIGYHRYFTHRSFKCGEVLQTVLAICGTIAIENSIKSWVSDHVMHHAKVDTAKDPYNATRGFWWSHIGWILFKDPDREDPMYSGAEHLMDNPASWIARLVEFQHKFYYPLVGFFVWGVPMLIASLWGDIWGGAIFAGFSARLMTWHGTFCINSLAHWKHWGSSQPYSRANTAQDSLFASLPTFGEGYHNYHHTFPRDYRNGPLWYNFDPSKWIIYWLSLASLSWDLIRVPREKIEAARIATLAEAG